MYHHVSGETTAAPEPNHIDRRYSVTAERFAEHVSALADQGYSTVPLDALICDGPSITVARPVVITFDDGYMSDLAVARPILDRLGWGSEHFITTAWIGLPGFMTWQNLRNLVSKGHGVHSHSMTHTPFDKLSPSGVYNELAVSKSLLQDGLGRPVHWIAIPGGHGDTRRVRRLAEAAGYRGMCTSQVGRNVPLSQPYAVRRISVTGAMTAEVIVRSAKGIGLKRAALIRSSYRAARRLLGAQRYDRVRAHLLQARTASPQ